MLEVIAKLFQETLAIFPVISDILIVNKHNDIYLNPPYQCCCGFKVTNNSNERGRGVRNLSKFSDCFQEGVFKRKSHYQGRCLNNFAIACGYI